MNMNNYHQYQSIENVSGKSLDNIKKSQDYLNIGNQIWFASEKIHGTNFSFTTDGTEVKCGRRQSYLGEDELNKFYGCDVIFNKYRNNVIELFNEQNRRYNGQLKMKTLQIFGELYGGGYEGYKSKTKPIQREVQYCPDVQFIAFDIYVTSESGKGFYESLNEVIDLCNEVSIPVVDILHEDSLETLVELNPTFLTTIPKRFGLPDIENNFAEGYVLRPSFECYTDKGERVILKLKSPQFKEHHSSKKMSVEIDVGLDDEQLRLCNHIAQYITESRLVNVKSKLMPDEKIQKIHGLFVNDAIEDAMKSESITDEDKELYNKGKTKIRQALSKEAYKLINSVNV